LWQHSENEGAASPELLARSIDAIREKIGPDGFVEIEVDTVEQFQSALKLHVEIILLDNMSVDELVKAVEIRRDAGLDHTVMLEASGGITLDNVSEIAATGVDRIAVGAITHSAPAVDIALDMD